MTMRYPRQTPVPQLPKGYIENGYFDKNGYALAQLIIDWPKEIANNLQYGMETAQLRRFFGEARRIERKIKAGVSFSSMVPDILRLEPYAADAVKKNKAPLLFRQFIEQNLKWARKDEKSFLKGFMPHFESIVAYFPKK